MVEDNDAALHEVRERPSAEAVAVWPRSSRRVVEGSAGQGRLNLVELADDGCDVDPI
jgi:hypothetical protein